MFETMMNVYLFMPVKFKDENATTQILLGASFSSTLSTNPADKK